MQIIDDYLRDVQIQTRHPIHRLRPLQCLAIASFSFSFVHQAAEEASKLRSASHVSTSSSKIV